MRSFQRWIRLAPRITRVTGAVMLVSATALAGTSPAPVQYFVNVQPIDVCPIGESSSCAPISLPNSQIGFTDSTSGQNITRAILNQASIDVNFLPTHPLFNANFLNINFTGSAQDKLTSEDLKTLSQQPGISGNPPPPSQPMPPLSSDPHTLNMFFVNTLTPQPPLPINTYYGMGWIGNNGIAIDAATFGFPPDGFLAAVDAPAHEIVHNFGLDHSTDNTALDNGSAIDMPPTNLMSAVRDVPNTDNAVTLLGQGRGTGTTDQLNIKQIHDIIDPAHPGASGTPMLTNSFLNPIPKIDTQISDTRMPADFSVTFQDVGRPNESLQTLTLTAPTGFLLESGTFEPLNADGDTPGIIANPMFTNCRSFSNDQQACGSLKLVFTGTPFVLRDQFDYSVDVCRQTNLSCDLVPLSELVKDLTGGTYAYQFSDGYQTTSTLQPLGDPILDANSWAPDLAIPTSLDLNLFTPFFTGLPCVMQPGLTTCPELELHADRYDLLVFETPEPPSIVMIFVGLGLWLVLDRRRGGRNGDPGARAFRRIWIASGSRHSSLTQAFEEVVDTRPVAVEPG
jgi:hypothetical protein